MQPKIERIVALECSSREITLFRRETGGKLVRETLPLELFLLARDASFFDSLHAEPDEIIPLTGDLDFTALGLFREESRFNAAAEAFRKGAGRWAWSMVRGNRSQNLMRHDLRLFQNLAFAELLILAIAVETTPDGKKLTAIDLAGAGGEKRLEAPDEKSLLSAFLAEVAQRDPDLITGHQLSRELLPLLEARCKAHKLAFTIGRDGQTPTHRSSRFNAAEKTIYFVRYEAFGRHLIDTLHLAILYDVSSRSLEDYELSTLAAHFHLASSAGAAAVLDLVNTLLPSYFYMTRILPLTLQDTLLRGNGSNLDALFTAAYLKAGHSLPLPEEGRSFAGALSRADRSGVFPTVWHADVRSLYPSILLAERWAPRRDELGIFPSLLGELRDFRLRAKDAMKKAADPAEKRDLNALQSSFKILINSFYGYLGFAQGAFNDYELAAKVTARGREILQTMLAFLEESGAVPIEMDTDGIYFQPPAGVSDPAAFQQEIQRALPTGIEVELDAVYQAMFSYKSKNYALLAPDGTVTLTGAALKSRAMEPYLREYLLTVVTALLKGEKESAVAFRRNLEEAITRRTIPLGALAKRETLNDSPDVYRRKLEAGTGRRSAAYELALHGKKAYRSGDTVSYFITGTKPKVAAVDFARLLEDAGPEREENSAYYLAKLQELAANFEPFLMLTQQE